MGSAQWAAYWNRNKKRVILSVALTTLALFSACDISPIPTPIPGEEEGDEFAMGAGDFEDPYTDNSSIGGPGGDPIPNEPGAEEGGEVDLATGDETDDETGAEVGNENGDSDFVGGGEGQNEGTDPPDTGDCDVISAPDVEEELDAECDEEPESSFDASPEQGDIQ